MANLADLLLIGNPRLRGQTADRNLALNDRPTVPNPEGGASTIFSMGFEDENGTQILIPRVSHEGTIMSPEEAIDYYYKTGEHLGKFRGPQRYAQSDKMGQAVHVQQETAPSILSLLRGLR